MSVCVTYRHRVAQDQYLRTLLQPMIPSKEEMIEDRLGLGKDDLQLLQVLKSYKFLSLDDREKETHQSQFLEAPLVRQADGELKNNILAIMMH